MTSYSLSPDDFWSGTFPEFLRYPDPRGDLNLIEMAALWPLRIRYLAMPHDPIVLNEGTDVFASYSEAVRESHGRSCCRIQEFRREEY